MPALPSPLRRQLDNAVRRARKTAESGARKSLEALAIHEPDPYSHMDEAQRRLRRRLRAQAKQLGDGESQTRRGSYEIRALVEKTAYDQWHRLLFARFLLENNLLISPDHGVPVSLEDCEELAPSLGLKDAWSVAARFAAVELPEIFRADDPAGAVDLPVEDRNQLIAIVTDLPTDVFTATDSLGWCYQFWQAERKDQVNAAGNKIGAEELPSVTQLFTEDYMVDFLLDNTLGAWWAGKVAAASSRCSESSKVPPPARLWSEATSEEDCRQLAALPGCPWKYLRFIRKEAEASGPCAFLDKDEPVQNQTGDLPHWRQPGVTYFVTFRCADSLPAEKLAAWRDELNAWMLAHPEPHDEDTRKEFFTRFPQRIQQWLDSGYGRCLLKKQDHRKLIQEALQHFHGTRYDLDEYVVAANHVHVLVTPRDGFELSDILHSWKSFTANRINEAEGLSGAFWQKESFDHIVRNRRSLDRFRKYIRDHDRDQRLEASATFTPAAGTFDGWPTAAADLKCLDPCMGSGHFIVAMFERLVALRIAEEKLDMPTAVAAVIRDNLFGLEIDPRCTQIAAFNLALAAWRLSGHCKLPAINLACSGLAPNATRNDWLNLTEDAPHLRFQMGALFDLFGKAPILGSLINPRADKAITYDNAFHELQPLLEKALAKESKDDSTHEMAVTAQGIAKAAEILADEFTLVATNVPYLGRGKQDDTLKEHSEQSYPDCKADLATCFVDRCFGFCGKGGTSALVTPQNWLYQDVYSSLRSLLLRQVSFDSVARLGPGAFGAINGEVVTVALITASKTEPHEFRSIYLIEAPPIADVEAKANSIREGHGSKVSQSSQLKNPDARIGIASSQDIPALNHYAAFANGLQTGDYPRFSRCFWELLIVKKDWSFFQTTIEKTKLFDGLHFIVYWQEGDGVLARSESSVIRGTAAWGKAGVAVSAMGALQVTIYSGQLYDDNTVVITPNDKRDLPAIWSYCASDDYAPQVRRLDQALKVRAPLVKVPFDLEYWRKVAAEKYPDGLPKPFSSDPTQWLFDGHPKGSDHPLHVAVARLLGYQWPRQTGSSFPDCPALGPDGLEALADDDGIVPISAVKGEVAAAERLRELLARAFGDDWSAARQEALLAQVDFAGSSLEDWLRNGFFEQHCKLFHHRPFVWHIWDGLKNGFSALVNYHKLTHANLEKLTYAYLGDWIRRQQTAVEAGEAGSDARLQAARHLQAMLKLILEGEPPYDIFVRWKPLAQQSIGWHPDLNDGVRMNIRPFMATDLPGGKKGAGLLRSKPNTKWEKDRGKEPQRPRTDFPWFWQGSTFTGDRLNDIHLTREQKQSARNASK